MEKSTAGQKIPKPGRGKYDREQLLGKIKQQHKKRTKAETSKRCRAQGKPYPSLQKAYIKAANPVIMVLDLHSNSSIFLNAYGREGISKKRMLVSNLAL